MRNCNSAVYAGAGLLFAGEGGVGKLRAVARASRILGLLGEVLNDLSRCLPVVNIETNELWSDDVLTHGGLLFS